MGVQEVRIDSGEDPYDFYKSINTKNQNWEIIGRIGFVSSLAIAFATFVPALWKKRRTYIPFPNGMPFGSLPQEIVIEEQQLPKPAPSIPRLSIDEKKKAIAVFGTLAKGVPSLLDMNRIRKLGHEINAVHPFSLFLELPKDYIQRILKKGNWLVVHNVIGGVKEGIDRELKNSNIDPYIPELAQAMKKKGEKIKELISLRSYKTLLAYLFEVH